VDWFRGIDYHQWTAGEDGVLQIEPVASTFGFVKTQRFSVGRDTYTFFWPPDNLPNYVAARRGQSFRKGDTVFRLRVSSGDRLFVDRMTYNFRRPERAKPSCSTPWARTQAPHYRGQDILVDNTHYIKRLVALSGEHVRSGRPPSRHQRHPAGRPHPRLREGVQIEGPPRDSVYSGHVNNKLAIQYADGVSPICFRTARASSWCGPTITWSSATTP